MGATDSQFLTAPDFSVPAMGADGVWGSAGGVALRESLRQGSVAGVMGLLKSMDAKGLAGALQESGFDVDAAALQKGRGALFESVKERLGAALELRVDGFGLARAQEIALPHVDAPFAAKEEKAVERARASSDVRLSFEPHEFDGSIEAAQVIQGIMRSSKVAVDLLGAASPGQRGSLVLVASQSLKQGVQGFGFEGVPGKYQVPLVMAELVDLHRQSAQEVAIASARTGLGVWAEGGKPKDLDDWVPDSVQRLLHGSISMDAANSVIDAIKGGSIAAHAGEIGEHQFTALLASQGLDVNARTVEEHAQESGWVIQEPDRDRGKYFGSVVAVDHRASLIKFTRENVMMLPFAELPEGQKRPQLGDSVRMDYKNGALTVAIADRVGREGTGR